MFFSEYDAKSPFLYVTTIYQKSNADRLICRIWAVYLSNTINDYGFVYVTVNHVNYAMSNTNFLKLCHSQLLDCELHNTNVIARATI